MKFRICYTDRIGGVKDQTVRGILENHGAVKVGESIGAIGEAEGPHELLYEADDTTHSLRDQLEDNHIATER